MVRSTAVILQVRSLGRPVGDFKRTSGSAAWTECARQRPAKTDNLLNFLGNTGVRRGRRKAACASGRRAPIPGPRDAVPRLFGPGDKCQYGDNVVL